MNMDIEQRIKMMHWELTANTYGSEMYEAIFHCKHDDKFYMVKWDFDFDTVPFENVVVSKYVTHGDDVSVAILDQEVLSSEISISSDVTVPVPENENDRV